MNYTESAHDFDALHQKQQQQQQWQVEAELKTNVIHAAFRGVEKLERGRSWSSQHLMLIAKPMRGFGIDDDDEYIS